MNINQLIEDEIRLGARSFAAIATKFGTTYSHVNLVWEQMCETEFTEE